MTNSVDIVHAFWDQVWNAHDAAAVDRFVVDDFVIVTGGEAISGRENFKKWIEGFLSKDRAGRVGAAAATHPVDLNRSR
jgi:ketosteroid isomerase-like protein